MFNVQCMLLLLLRCCAPYGYRCLCVEEESEFCSDDEGDKGTEGRGVEANE
jgi:hypothetical protein